jgi:hypothetical protein
MIGRKGEKEGKRGKGREKKRKGGKKRKREGFLTIPAYRLAQSVFSPGAAQKHEKTA